MTGSRARDIPDLTGKRAIVTGANSGLGYFTALELARHGASVVVAVRDPARSADALRRMQQRAPSSELELAALDLADLASVRTFAEEQATRPLDILINNAGVMALPRRTTADGFEMQLGTNHLGHYALTGLLLPALSSRVGARVISVSSVMHWMGSMDFDNLMGEQGYQPWTAYAQSKLANLLFMRELDARAKTAGLQLVSAAAHPGFTKTHLYSRRPVTGGRQRLDLATLGVAARVVGQGGAKGALPQLHAATAPGVQGGDYFGPRGPAELRGLPKRVRMSKNAQDDAAAQRLWDVSEQLTGVSFGLQREPQPEQ